jgi:hypothetical protein
MQLLSLIGLEKIRVLLFRIDRCFKIHFYVKDSIIGRKIIKIRQLTSIISP